VTVYQYIVDQFPEFKSYVANEPDWFRQFNYGAANRVLNFAVDLKRRGDANTLKRLFHHIERGLRRDDVENPLCLDFIQRIPDIGADYKDDFVQLLGPEARRCYNNDRIPDPPAGGPDAKDELG
jgi:hypothetical protein